jgi:imidazolonepropionase
VKRALCNLLLENAAEVLTMERTGLVGPRRGEELREIGRIENATIGVAGEEISWVGPSSEASAAVDLAADALRVDVSGRAVVPGFIDSHTHLPFAGWRHDEFERRLRGETYQEIADAGGGIQSSVRLTRAASEEEIASLVRARLGRLLLHGTTTVEAKSGYGLSTPEELKQLRALSRGASGQDVEVVPTFLGAHEFPPEHREDRERYVDLLVQEMIPAVAAEKLAVFADVFCERGVYSVEQARRVLETARDYGMEPRLHADEFAPSGAAELAAEIGAYSADHLSAISDAGIRALAASETIGTLLPGTTFSLRIPPADARRLVSAGVALSIATDFNPGSSAIDSMSVAIGLACLHLRMSPGEALVASTINAAFALGRAQRVGSIRCGKQADLVVLDAPDWRHLAYRFGSNLVQIVIKKGKIVARDGILVAR